MAATLRDILGDPRFSVRPVVGVDDGVLSAELAWAVSTESLDPAPWLRRGAFVLTLGSQLVDATPAEIDAYVGALAAHGARVLGLSTRAFHDQLPAELVAACQRHALALVEISHRTPMLGILRFVEDARSTEVLGRTQAALRAQEAVARAALRPDGLESILAELERSLGCWVALFDDDGLLMDFPTIDRMPRAIVDPVTAAAREALRSGSLMTTLLNGAATGEATLHTVGSVGEIHGVLAVGAASATLERAEAVLLDASISLAGTALEQSRRLASARRSLRSGILELLSAGSSAVADSSVEHLGGPLPAAPLRVGCALVTASGTTAIHALRSALELHAEQRRGEFFFAEQARTVITLAPAGDDADLRAILTRQGLRAGFATAPSWERVDEAIGEARRALSRTTSQQPFVDFEDLVHLGLLGHLERTNAHEVARRIVGPLDEADPAVRRSLEVWLEQNGSWDRAAKELGVHRHTLRSRIDTAGSVLGLDLGTFAARAELWSALQLTAR